MRLTHTLKRLSMAAMCALLLAVTASAQFTGIAPTSSPGLNVRRPLTTDQAILYPADRELRMIAGDVLTITVYGVDPVYTDTERVSLDGTITLPLGGTVSVGGLTLAETSAALAKRFQEREVFNNAQINIVLGDTPAHIATLIGEVHANVPVLGYKRLYDVLSLGGGMPATASTTLYIDRPGLKEQIVVDLGNDPANSAAANIPIFAGDTITVGRIGQFYVVGAVTAPGIHPLNASTPTTVMQAIAASGGTRFEAIRNSTKLIRTVGNQRTVIPINEKDIVEGKAPDPVLQADDIILVPANAMKALLRSGGLTSITATLLASIAIANSFK